MIIRKLLYFTRSYWRPWRNVIIEFSSVGNWSKMVCWCDGRGVYDTHSATAYKWLTACVRSLARPSGAQCERTRRLHVCGCVYSCIESISNEMNMCVHMQPRELKLISIFSETLLRFRWLFFIFMFFWRLIHPLNHSWSVSRSFVQNRRRFYFFR